MPSVGACRFATPREIATALCRCPRQPGLCCAASCRRTKTLEHFEFERLPKLNRALIHDLATGRYLHEKAPVLMVGPSGIDKSHLAQALGHCAVRQGHDVVFTSCAGRKRLAAAY